MKLKASCILMFLGCGHLGQNPIPEAVPAQAPATIMMRSSKYFMVECNKKFSLENFFHSKT